MYLTSLSRVKNALGKTSTAQDGVLGRLIAAASRDVEDFLRRVNGIELKSRTEYHSPTSGQRTFPLRAYPITAITSVKVDGTGLFTGSQITLDATDYAISDDGKSVVLVGAAESFGSGADRLFVGPNTLQVVYTAGLAASATQGVYAKNTETGGTFTVGYYVQGLISGAIAKVISRTASALTYEAIAGELQVGERIDEYTTLNNSLESGGLTGGTSVFATLSTHTTSCLAELYPNLVEGVEWHINFLNRERHNSEVSQVQQEGELRNSPDVLSHDSFSIPIVRKMLREFIDTRLSYHGVAA